MGIWDSVLNLVAEGKLVASSAATLVNAGIAAYHDVKSGGSATPLEAMLKQSKDVLPILESVANFIMPGSGTGIEALAFVLSHSHKMTPEEEAGWMDRASRADNGGA